MIQKDVTKDTFKHVQFCKSGDNVMFFSLNSKIFISTWLTFQLKIIPNLKSNDESNSWLSAWCLFHQHFTSRFLLQKCFLQLFFKLQFGFVIFWKNYVGAKSDCKMLMKLTAGFIFSGLFRSNRTLHACWVCMSGVRLSASKKYDKYTNEKYCWPLLW